MNNKLTAFTKLKGTNEEDNKLIQKEKTKYLFNRISLLFGIGKRYTLGKDLPKAVIAKSKGLFYCRERSFDLHIILESYEFKVKQLYEKLAKESKVIVDVGSNIGKYTILASLINPKSKVYSIEPEKGNFEVLSKNISLNNLKNVQVINIGLGQTKNNLKLYKSDKNRNYGAYSFVNKSPHFKIIAIDSFDNIFRDKEKKIDLLKIDVEGFELDVLKGMTFFLSGKRIKNILIEIDDENYNEVVSILEDYGYFIKHIMYNNYWSGLR